MKIFISIYVIALLNTHFIKAQSSAIQAISTTSELAHNKLSEDSSSKSNKTFYITARLGLNYANLNFNKGFPKPILPVDTQWKVGPTLGLSIRIPINKQLSLQQEYAFTQVRSTVKIPNIQYTLSYLTLPTMAKYTLISRVTVVAGVQFDLLLSAKESALGKTHTITHDTEERGFDGLAGLEIQLSKHISSSARFLKGLNHITIGKYSGGQEFKTEAVQLALDITL